MMRKSAVRWAGVVAATALVAVTQVACVASSPTPTGKWDGRSDPEQPCAAAKVKGSKVALLCDDGKVTFDILKFEDGEAIATNVMAGSHKVWQVVRVGDELRFWYDPLQHRANGSSTARVTIVDAKTGDVLAFGY